MNTLSLITFQKIAPILQSPCTQGHAKTEKHTLHMKIIFELSVEMALFKIEDQNSSFTNIIKIYDFRATTKSMNGNAFNSPKFSALNRRKVMSQRRDRNPTLVPVVSEIKQRVMSARMLRMKQFQNQLGEAHQRISVSETPYGNHSTNPLNFQGCLHEFS